MSGSSVVCLSLGLGVGFVSCRYSLAWLGIVRLGSMAGQLAICLAVATPILCSRGVRGNADHFNASPESRRSFFKWSERWEGQVTYLCHH